MPRLPATLRAGNPLVSSFLAALTLVSVICRFQPPPVRPSWASHFKDGTSALYDEFPFHFSEAGHDIAEEAA